MEIEFSRQIFEKNSGISNFMEARPVGAEFHADGQTCEADSRLISGFHRAFLQSITFIIRLMHSII